MTKTRPGSLYENGQPHRNCTGNLRQQVCPGFADAQMGVEVCYTMTLNEKGERLEIGEFSRDGGKNR